MLGAPYQGALVLWAQWLARKLVVGTVLQGLDYEVRYVLLSAVRFYRA
jgi:hypothetical protein